MNEKEILRHLISESNWSQNKMAMELGQTPQEASQRMQSKGSLKVDFFKDMLGVLGYELAVVPKHSTLPQRSLVVGGGDES